MFNRTQNFLKNELETLETPLLELPEIKEEVVVAEKEIRVKWMTRLIEQIVIAIICMFILSAIVHSQHPWMKWARVRIHLAINASSQNTFAIIYNSVVMKKFLNSCSSLIRFKEITQEASSPAYRERGTELFRNAVWPVEGSVARGYGWQNNPDTHLREFFPGVEITGKPKAEVLALANGEITRVSRVAQDSWEIMIDHGLGWVSIYQNLNQVKVSVGQKVVSGMVLASLKGERLLLEIRYYERPIDPLSMLVS